MPYSLFDLEVNGENAIFYLAGTFNIVVSDNGSEVSTTAKTVPTLQMTKEIAANKRASRDAKRRTLMLAFQFSEFFSRFNSGTDRDAASTNQ